MRRPRLAIALAACIAFWAVLCLSPAVFSTGANSTQNVTQPRTERFSEIALPKCGFWSSRGVIWSARYADGSRLEVWCRTRHWFAPVPVYRLMYFTPDGRRHQLARCPFWCGCNEFAVMESSRKNRFTLDGILWDSVKGRASQGAVKLLPHFTTGRKQPSFDEAEWVFNVNRKRETVILRKYTLLGGYRKAPCGCAIRKFRGQLIHRATREIPW